MVGALLLLQVEQVLSPGFHMITLPYKDDVRTPEAEAVLLKRLDGGPPRANADQVLMHRIRVPQSICNFFEFVLQIGAA